MSKSSLLSTSVSMPVGDHPYCINPWRQQWKRDAMVRPSDIVVAELVWFGRGDERNWFQVLTKDGREIQTELAKHQPNYLQLALSIHAHGVRFLVHMPKARNVVVERKADLMKALQ